ncbi:hypothetical protein [Leptospira licerasiae]|uniref:Cytochrome C n=1 Tax=Leptospira licerasiae str. MMD4847 TaxID=1049971 RepID=A0ABN0H4A4_9LEPT|nr:hypothetical protein [Leptospira licerasiae]EIE02110.1 hypothetical protein LEP1GSC185_1744 [Leptospira licerasiae serovar Varillal str. VAR 010]EJZ40574.1 hypothetical protein LEP1GSC178_1010 [Leptospira licerasiae str. MMD4847]
MNRTLKNICFTLLFLLGVSASYAQSGTTETTLHDFMEDYTKPASKKAKKGDKAALERILKEVPNWALDEQKAKWKEITDTALASGDLESSCKNCHKEYKKEYKKSYRKRPIQVSNDLISFLKNSK